MAFRSDLDALILAALMPGPLHGYEIAKRIRLQSQDVLKIGENLLYPALHRLEQERLVTGSWAANDNKAPRKVYELTEKGKKTLSERKEEWSTFVTAVNGVLGTMATGGAHGA